MLITTVGDQLFTLTQEVKKLKRRCDRYERTLRRIAAENRRMPCPERSRRMALEGLHAETELVHP